MQRSIVLLLAFLQAACAACGPDEELAPVTHPLPIAFLDNFGDTTVSIDVDGVGVLDEYTRADVPVFATPVDVVADSAPVVSIFATSLGRDTVFRLVVDEPSPDAADPVYLIRYGYKQPRFRINGAWVDRGTIGIALYVGSETAEVSR